MTTAAAIMNTLNSLLRRMGEYTFSTNWQGAGLGTTGSESTWDGMQQNMT